MNDIGAANDRSFAATDGARIDTHWSRILHVDIFNGNKAPVGAVRAIGQAFGALLRRVAQARRHVDEARASTAAVPRHIQWET